MEGKKKLRDRLLLLGAGVVCALLSVMFWRFAGEKGFTILITMVMVGSWLDNWRLRKRVRELEQQLSISKRD